MMTTRNWAIGMAVLGAFLFCLAWSTQAADSAQPKGTPLRILWAGSSSLYYHNAPKVFAQWLVQQGGRPVVSELVGRSGTGVHIAVLPGWMKMNTLGTKPEKVDNGTAAYLRNVAWEEHQGAQKRLQEVAGRSRLELN